VKLLLPLLLLAFAAAAGSADQSRVDLDLRPRRVGLDMLFDGAQLRVEAEAAGSYTGGAVTVVGDEEALELRMKGRVWGVLWMSVADVRLQHVPSTYLLSTSDRLASLAPPAVLEGLGVGYPAVASRAVLSSEVPLERSALLDELVKLKQGDGLFAVSEGDLTLEALPGGKVRFATTVGLPARLGPGAYEVRLYGFEGGDGSRRGRLLATDDLIVRQVGLAAVISSLARESGLLYGVIAVAVAIAVGLLTGYLFGRGAKGGH
jgi:hypothetical protein